MRWVPEVSFSICQTYSKAAMFMCWTGLQSVLISEERKEEAQSVSGDLFMLEVLVASFWGPRV